MSYWLHVELENIEVPIVESAKNLGLVFDRTLRFKEHLNNLINKAFSSLNLLYAARDILCQKLKKQLCESLFYHISIIVTMYMAHV
jgi:hypothetical protein